MLKAPNCGDGSVYVGVLESRDRDQRARRAGTRDGDDVPGAQQHGFVGSLEQKIVADVELPTGEQLVLSAAFEKDGEDPPGVAVGTLSLFHGDVKVGE